MINNDYEINKRGIKAAYRVCYACIVGILLCFAITLMTSCKSVEYVPVVETQYHHDSIYFTNVKFDSIYVHDSVSVKESGDTVRIERWHTKYKEKQVRDTVYQAKTDSVRVPVPYEVEKKLTAFQQLKMDYGGYALLIVIFTFIYIIYRLTRRFLP